MIAALGRPGFHGDMERKKEGVSGGEERRAGERG
jgi:hypothetical protein